MELQWQILEVGMGCCSVEILGKRCGERSYSPSGYVQVFPDNTISFCGA